MAGQLRLLSGATALQTEAIDLQKEANTWAEAFKTFQGISGVAEQVNRKEEQVKNLVDAHVAKQDAEVFNQAVSNQNGTERRASYEGILGDITGQFERGEISSGYYQGYMGAIEKKYSTALSDQIEEYNNAVGEAAGTEFITGVRAGVAGPAIDYIDNISSSTGVPKNVIRDGVLSGIYSSYTNEISAVSTIEELNNIVTEFTNVKNTNLDSTQLLKTRSKELSAIITQKENDIKNAIELKKKQFKYEANSEIAAAVGSIEDPLTQYNKPPEAIDKAMKIAFGDNPRTYNSEMNTYKEKYNEHQEARAFYAANNVYSVVDAGKVKGNEVLKPMWETQVQDTFLQSYLQNDMNGAVKIGNTQSAFLGEVGNTLYSQFSSSADPVLLKGFMEADRMFRNTPGGVSAHNNLYSKEQRQSIVMTDIVTSSIGFDDPIKAREMVYKAQAAPIKPLLPNTINRLQDVRRKELGSAYQDYRASLNVLNNLEGADIVAGEKKLVEYYKGIDISEKGFTISTQYGTPKPSLDKDKHYDYTKKLITAIGYEPDDVDLKVMPDGTIAINDKVFDTPLGFINPDKIEAQIEEDIKNAPPAGPLERKLRGAGEAIISTAATTQEAVTESTIASAANIGNKQGTLTFGFFTNVFLGAYKYLTNNGKDLESEGSSNNPVDKKYVIARQLQDTKLTQVVNTQVVDNVLKYEGGYSTDVEDKGNYNSIEDYNNRTNFVGTNFGISAPVLSEYLGRKATEEDMKQLSKQEATDIIRTQYYDRYNVADTPPEMQKIVLNAMVLSPTNAKKALQGTTDKTEFADKFLALLKDNASTWDKHGKGWTSRFTQLKGE